MPDSATYLRTLLQSGNVHHNLPASALIEEAIRRGEGILSDTGAFVVRTGKYTGRSPDDKFIVGSPETDPDIDWGKVNRPFDPNRFEPLFGRVLAHLAGRDLFVFDGYGGADPDYRLPVRVVTEAAWHNLFARQLLIRPTSEEMAGFEPEFTIINAGKFQGVPEIDGTKSETFILLDLKRKIVLIGGTEYAGEIKKSVFTILNYLLPNRNVFPMHCSANTGATGDVALFFGLSGTGKTTLSADPQRCLIGDDEHGWSDTGVFNFEGGCYAKCIRLSRDGEPQIWSAIHYGTVLENVVINSSTRQADFDNASLTENTRAAYPIDFIPGAILSGTGRHPRTVFFLTADVFGVLPPIARLTADQAMYHFLSGYTSRLAGTERGITTPTTAFSTCFGAPFMPLAPVRYARMLGQRLAQHDATCFLVNTGWTGGPYGVGHRMDLATTRHILSAALRGDLNDVEYTRDSIFGLHVPVSCPEVPAHILQARNTWENGDAYDETATQLASKFVENFKQFSGVDDAIRDAGPCGRA
ncbi:MAG: phosphoenolpyruvate carboxykinase (ATP) [Capsulimonadaceae bacterium]